MFYDRGYQNLRKFIGLEEKLKESAASYSWLVDEWRFGKLYILASPFPGAATDIPSQPIQLPAP